MEVHGNNLGLKVIKHKTGGDPAAVIFDAIEYSRAHNKDVVLADTAGRLHTNINLMDQMKKIVRVTNPDLLIFVDEAIAGNDAVERARLFNESVPIGDRSSPRRMPMPKEDLPYPSPMSPESRCSSWA